MFRNANYIYAVYRERNFSRAAEKLFISQSSLSLTIKKAEERIGAPIFNRSASPITLTEFGEQYIAAYEEVVRLQNRLENYVYGINHMKHGHLSIGAPNFHATYLFPRTLAIFQEAFPNISVSVHEGITQNLAKMLGAGDLDLLFTNVELSEKQYQKHVLCHDFMVLAVPARFCPSDEIKRRAKTREELSHYPDYSEHDKRLFLEPSFLTNFRDVPFVLLRPGNGSRNRADKAFSAAGFFPFVATELDQASTAYRLACTGFGATLVNNLYVRTMEPSAECLLFPLDSQNNEQYLNAYLPQNAILMPVIEEFIRIMRENVLTKAN